MVINVEVVFVSQSLELWIFLFILNELLFKLGLFLEKIYGHSCAQIVIPCHSHFVLSCNFNYPLLKHQSFAGDEQSVNFRFRLLECFFSFAQFFCNLHGRHPLQCNFTKMSWIKCQRHTANLSNHFSVLSVLPIHWDVTGWWLRLAHPLQSHFNPHLSQALLRRPSATP